MSRPIKFRAWNPHFIEMMYSDSMPGESNLGQFFMMEHKYKFPIMQFTGLLDKASKEIWEGDIVNLWNCTDNFMEGRGFILWDQETAGFVHTWEEWFDNKPSGQFRPHKKLWLSQFPKIELEVIGNVYETPELLKAEEGMATSDSQI